MTESEKAFLDQKRKELKEKKAKCSSVCPFYDHHDHDCDRFGMNHPSPCNCGVYLMDCLHDWKKEEEVKE